MKSTPGRADPLRIVSIAAGDFRNLARLEFEPAVRFNIIHGDNGAGKSNLLELIDYVGTLRSFRGARAGEIVKEGSKASKINARIALAEDRRTHEIRIPRTGTRQVTIDGKRARSRASYRKETQIVLFHPGNMELVAGPASTRREYLDRILEQFDATYGSTLTAYKRALKSRNRLLSQDSA